MYQRRSRSLLLLLALAGRRRPYMSGHWRGREERRQARVEIFRKRSDNLLSIHTDVLEVLSRCAETAARHPSMNDPHEMVVRVLRPVKE
jgi:hypothetical protein